MNTNPSATTVLCYGDSNTHGTKPDRSGRFNASERWTGILQQLLGDTHYVIEEGLGGRTTDVDHPNPAKPSRNGFEYFKACVGSHAPLDVVILMLGTNDCKTVYNRSPQEIAEHLVQYIDYLKDYANRNSEPVPRIILVSPAYMDENAEKFYESMPTAGIYDAVSAAKTRQFAAPFAAVASAQGIEFFDAGPIAPTGADGCHITLEAHNELGKQLAAIIKTPVSAR